MSNMRQLGIRVRAVLLALDEALAEADHLAGASELRAGTRPLSPEARVDLRGLLDTMEADLGLVAAEHEAEERNARDWAQRTRIAAETGRLDLRDLAELRQAKHTQAAAALAVELARTRELIRHCETALGEGQAAPG